MHELQNSNMTLWCCCDRKGCHCRAAGGAEVQAYAHMQLHNMAAPLPKLHEICHNRNVTVVGHTARSCTMLANFALTVHTIKSMHT